MVPLRRLRDTAQKFLIPDSLTHSSGMITAIVGSKTYSCTITGGLSQVTRYQLYITPGTTTLQFSTRENSLGPVGFTSWILIGSFYSTGTDTPVWGSFVNITDTPRSGVFTLRQNAAAINFVSGFAFAPVVFGHREGDMLFAGVHFRKDGANGTGGILVTVEQLPNITIRTGAYVYAGEDHILGEWYGYNISALYPGLISETQPMYSPSGAADTPAFGLKQGASGGGLSGSHVLAGAEVYGKFRYYVQEWSNTPLKDL